LPNPLPDRTLSVASRGQQLSALIKEHDQALHAFLLNRLRDVQEAREVAQEAYVQVLQLENPDTISYFRAYLFKTASNIAINRSKQRRFRGAADQAIAVGPLVDQLTPDRRVLAAEELQVFKQALFELPPKCRQAFILYRFNEWSQREIAARLHIQERMVRHYLLQAGIYCKLRIQGCSIREAKAQLNP
jgi:RNA polymerase sigma factor (sigma-70 family)